MDACADVLPFLEEFHLRATGDYGAQDVEHGETVVLRLVKDALRIQAGIDAP